MGTYLIPLSVLTTKTQQLTTTIDITAERLVEGDHSAYEQIFRQWYEALCNYACSIVRDMDEAEDIVQKTFCKLWDQRAEVVIHTSIKSYLYRIVHNDCINRVKQRKVRMEHNQNYAYSMVHTVDNVSGQLAYSELERQAAKALEELPPQCKKVFELSRLEQLSYAEIAMQLGISTNTVENHMSKALRLMRQGLKDFLPFLLLFILKQFKL